MSKDPAILFYTSDFLTGTMTMTNDQVGKYIRLLCVQHQKGIITEKDMLFICQSYDEDIYGKFIKTDDGYYNKRMRFEAEKRAKYSQSRADNRSNLNKKTTKKHMKKICKTYDEHMENENENINENINNKNNESEFEVFWRAYPKKSGSKKAAFDNWKKLNGDKPNIDTILTAIKTQKLWRENAAGEFRPEWKDPERWIKGRMWEVELSEDKSSKASPPPLIVSCPVCGGRVTRSDLTETGCVNCRVGIAP
jgi:hypothetical protein